MAHSRPRESQGLCRDVSRVARLLEGTAFARCIGMLRAGLPLTLLCAVACGAAASRDAGPECVDDSDCGGPESGNTCSEFVGCRGPCLGTPDGRACNTGVSDFPPTCCAADEVCCAVDFEYEACLDATRGCPLLCYGAGGYFSCDRGSRCLVQEPSIEADAGGLDGGGVTPDAGLPACLPTADCEEDCPADSQCGAYCCGPGTRCDMSWSCCVLL